ncbi:MAG: ECF-type sigma factor [Planctomycetota bacterium]
MKDVTTILQAVALGDADAERELLDRVYQELHSIAERKLLGERAGMTLQSTDLVHETYMRLFAHEPPCFENRRHFFAAAAEAMRRILIERARKRTTERAGGAADRVEIEMGELPIHGANDRKLIKVDAALDQLEAMDPRKAKLVKLRFFSGLTIKETAETLGISTATADRQWRFVRSWLQTLFDES